jgi:hypothetical protein
VFAVSVDALARKAGRMTDETPTPARLSVERRACRVRLRSSRDGPRDAPSPAGSSCRSSPWILEPIVFTSYQVTLGRIALIGLVALGLTAVILMGELDLAWRAPWRSPA